ncbi:hypothetical protein AF331_07565 [Rossellomorea marisflavi]|uniref:Abortive phage infection protein n=1 Tax=Rossellomorea marisflavi TaxID=189381 RepID=A0A0M0GS44_9BACI|nr:hypothetical protein [Rossellomorea marisflavi]KON92297.1 hypothetical protein AF331_07565 [Rossellomorea marisflavi]
MDVKEIEGLVEGLRTGELNEVYVRKEDFLSFRSVLVKQKDFKHFRGIAAQGGHAVYHYLETARS